MTTQVSPPELSLAKTLDWLVPLAGEYKVKFGAYIALIVAFWAALFTIPKSVDAFLPAAQTGQEWRRNWLAVGFGLGVPTLIILVADGLPALMRRRRDRRLIEWGVNPARYGYFRLTPYERKDQGRFRRADGADVAVLGWLREAEPTVLYLTGRSGVGKSSLLNASVLPALETGESPWSTVTVRTFGDFAADLAAALRRPGLLYKQPPKEWPVEILPLLRLADRRLKERGGKLLVAIDQFEEFLIFHDLDPARQAPLRDLLTELEREPLERIRLLLSMRSDYLEDVARLGLPRLSQGRNWMQVDAFTEQAACDFLRGGFGEEGIGEKLVALVVRHASDLDGVRNKVRPIVLNMIGQALGARSGDAARALRPGEAQRLIADHVREGLNDPISRDHAPKILATMVTPEGNKGRPASASDLAAKTGLGMPLIQGCLARLDELGFVRPFDSDPEHSQGSQVWEISHDFVARLLGLILPALRPTIGRRLRRALGPALMLVGIAGVFGLIEFQQVRAKAELERVDQLQRWAGKYFATMTRDESGMFFISFPQGAPNGGFAVAIHDDCSPFASLINNLSLSNHGLTNLPPEIAKFKNLKWLNIDGNGLSRLPPELAKLTGLRLINLGGNRLAKIPDEITSLGGLETLILRGNGLEKLPDGLGRMTRLLWLDLGDNRLQSLPEGLGNLTALTELDLNGNELTGLPDELGSLKSLKTLRLGNNRLTRLPNGFGDLTALTILDLNNNGLGNLPPEIGKLKALANLSLVSDNLTTLPDEITDLTGLMTLDLGGNRLERLPDGFGDLKGLKWLNLSNNGLTTLPDEVTRLQSLQTLHVAGNHLTNLPDGIGNLPALTELVLVNNGLSKLPPAIGKLKALTLLNLANNGLMSLPGEFAGLSSLTSLDLTGNRLTTLPDGFGKLKRLTRLGLAGNGLTPLPPEFVELKSLAWLDLSNNGLTSLPRDFARLTSLTGLGLGGNTLRTFPPQLAAMTGLTDLDLGRNGLKNLSPEIGSLRSLRMLDLSNNDLANLPYKLGELKGLKTLILNQNPLVEPPREVIAGGPDAVLIFLRSKPDAATDEGESPK